MIWLNIGMSWKITKIPLVSVSHPKQVEFPKMRFCFYSVFTTEFKQGLYAKFQNQLSEIL